MNALNNKSLCKKHPKIFSQKNSIFCSSIGRSFECGDGWYKIIDDLASQLDAIRVSTKIQVKAQVVKEKFGGLRFQCDYVFSKSLSKKICNSWWAIIHSVISCAENKSFQTCEECGKYGKLQQISGWYSTLCSECGKKHYGKGWK